MKPLVLSINFTLFFHLGLIAQGDSLSLSPAQEAHYQYLTNELNQYRSYLQQERTEHRQFLERGMTIVSIFVGIVGTVLGVLGVRTYRDIRKQLQDFRQNAEQKLQQDLAQARAQFASDARAAFAQDPGVKEAERKYQALTQLVNTRIAVDQGTYLLLAYPDKLAEMQAPGEEVSFLAQAFPNLTTLTAPQLPELSTLDVLIYRVQVDGEGEDAFLRDQLLPSLQQQKAAVPLVVYAKGFSERIKGETSNALTKYPLHVIANMTPTLIDNIASSYRAHQLIDSQKPSV